MILIIAMLLAWRWLKRIDVLPDTSFTAITGVFITVALWFIAAIFFFAFITSFIPWLLFLINKKHQRVAIEIKTAIRENKLNTKQEVFLSIRPILKPVFGYIRLRLQYDENKVSDKFSLKDDGQRQKLFSTTERGIYRWPLADIKEYKVTNCIVYFEDMFQFFSFASGLPAGDNFITQPQHISSPGFSVQPKKTEYINTRIDRIRKVEGEFLNYKNFENNDDVRRIVWKIYAKNKELVIRIPETNDPYASHVYFYASFYNALGSQANSDFNDVFLNHFKTMVWNCYYHLSKQNPLVKYIADHDNKTIFSGDPLQKVKLIISTSVWHLQKDLFQYFKKEEGSVLCISSLTDPAQLENALNNADKDLVVVFVMLSKTFSIVKITDWIQWIFIKAATDSLQNLRIIWNFSPFKTKLISNEKNIITILNNSGCEILMV
jgi:hypothetical protein